MKKLERFWLALEAVSGLSAVPAQWQALTGNEYEIVQMFLMPTGRLAASFPRLNVRSKPLPYRVVEHGPNDYVGICPEGGDSVRLRKKDLIIYKLDHQKLSRSLSAAFGLEAGYIPLVGLPHTWRVGTCSVGTGDRVPVVLTIQSDAHELQRTLTGVLGEVGSALILLTPSSAMIAPDIGDLIARKDHVHLIVLAETIDVDDNGELCASQTMAEITENMRTSSPPRSTGGGPYYLTCRIRETVFEAETLESSMDAAFDETLQRFYRVNDIELARKLVGLFNRKLGEDTAAIGRRTEVDFEFVDTTHLDEADRFLIEEEINKIASDVSGYRAQWQIDCLELDEPVWNHDPYNPPLYKEDQPLCAESLHHQAEIWETALRPDEEELDTGDGIVSSEQDGGTAKTWPDPSEHTVGKCWTTQDGAFHLSTKTDGQPDGKASFATGSNQAGLMQLLCYQKWRQQETVNEQDKEVETVLLADALNEVYPKAAGQARTDPELLRTVLKRLRSLVSDIRTKKLEPAGINPEVVPPLNVESSIHTGIGLRLSYLHYQDAKSPRARETSVDPQKLEHLRRQNLP